jgi:xanthine dehydrogenase small subunit
MPYGMLVLDFVRYHKHLTGTKIGCREGDCGACTVLIGEIKDNKLLYRSATSCLTPLGNIHGKHVVTIEGVNFSDKLNPVQQFMQEESATQCGFCTPGFIMSLAGFCLSDKEPTEENAIAAVDGNICRCTGYKSIERAVKKVATLMQKRTTEDAALYATQQHILPEYFGNIKERLQLLIKQELKQQRSYKEVRFVGGGTDLYVQKHDEMVNAEIDFVVHKTAINLVAQQNNTCIIGAAATVTDLAESAVMQKHFPKLKQYIKLVSSTPIRNIATVAGNFVNASPIGDLTIFFLALDAQIILTGGIEKRTVPLRKFYKGYKQLDKLPEEHIEQIYFELPNAKSAFNFEKVCKRTHLDIASVNTAIHLKLNDNIIEEAGVSAGGVGPVPAFLEKTAAFLEGKTITEELINEAISITQTEVAPISDARGAEVYKRLLLSQLIKAHFIEMGFIKEKI